MPVTDRLILTCEHGGNDIPRRYAAHFRTAAAALRSHRGWDPGALELARDMARDSGAPLVWSTTSRLLVDLNRSEPNPRVFSREARRLPEAERARLLAAVHRPFRHRAERLVRRLARAGNPVLHLSVHSFTPVLGGQRRNADIGLLYDPSRPRERALAQAWRAALVAADPSLRVRMNYPYRGISDGHTTSLRGRFPADRYLGIEVEVNQALVRAGGRRWAGVKAALSDSLRQARAAPTGGATAPRARPGRS